MIVLIPIGEVEEATLEALRQPLTEVFGQRTRIGNKLELPRESWLSSGNSIGKVELLIIS